MQGQRLYESTIPEQTVIRIMRKLSPERVSDLVDYARFLEFRAGNMQLLTDSITAADQVLVF